MTQRISAADLYREHAGFTANFIFRLGVAERDVPDLVQEVFLVAHRKGGFRPGAAKPRTWLCGIAVRLVANHRRRRRASLDSGAMEQAVSETSPESRAAARQALVRVRECLAALDEPLRAVFVMFELEGFKATEIADALDIPEGTVHSRLHRARDLFRSRYEAEHG